MKRTLLRLRYLLHRRRADEELASEMEFHREMAAREGRDTSFGNALQLREQSREAWGWLWIDRLFQDLRYTARTLRQSPGFTLAAILMLAIGIGANVAAFAFFDMMVLRPMNVREPDTLLRFHRRAPQAYAFALPYPELAFFRDHSRTLSAVLALHTTRLSIDNEDSPLTAHFVSPNYFAELGALALLGRLLEPARDNSPGAEPSVVLSQGFWRRHFGADPLVVGKSIHINGQPATVLGVAAAEFGGLSFDEPALWASISLQPYFVKGSRLLTDYSADSGGVMMWGRLQPGVGPSAAEAELKSLAAELRKQQPEAIWENESLPSEPGGYATSLRRGTSRGTGTEGSDKLLPLFALVAALVLLILAVACCNLGSLLLARGVSRQREISIRISVGAGAARLVRQLFTESLTLALLGSAVGLFVGYALLRSLMTLTAGPTWLTIAPDWRVVAFAVAMGFFAAVLFGLAPAWQMARQRHRATIIRQFLVTAQVTASCVLLIVAALLGRALNHAVSTHPGFEYERAVSINPGLARNGYTPARSRVYLDTLQSRLRALPGVASVSLALTPPLGNGSITAGVTIDGRSHAVQINHVSPEFLDTLRIPLLRGRNLAAGDTNVVVISESLARAGWPSQDALGHTLDIGQSYTVVGITGNARTIKLEDSDAVEAYLPINAQDLPSSSILVRVQDRAADLAQPIAVTVRSLDPDIFPEVQLVKSGFLRKLQGAKYSAAAVSALGAIAHVLACLGILGVVAYSVSQRTKEIGIRLALGAEPARLLASVLRQFTLPVAAGLIAGAAAAAALSTVLRSILYGIDNLDPATYLVTIFVFLTTIVAAALIPASRALRVDPCSALRHE